MEYNENLVTEEVTENVEGTTTEETVEQVTEPKLIYSEEDFKQMFDTGVKKKLARQEAKLRREYERKYGNLVEVLKAGTGKETVEEMTDTFSDFYRAKGIDVSKKPTYSKNDIEVLARVEAEEIIKSGYDEVKEEADRLNDLGVENMTEREKALFIKLTDHIKNTETGRELSKIGVKEDVYCSEEFKSFASKFDSRTPITEIYEIYNKTQPRKNIKTAGSMKQTKTDKVKDYYSPEDIARLTEEDLANPEVWKNVRRSMTGV